MRLRLFVALLAAIVSFGPSSSAQLYSWGNWSCYTTVEEQKIGYPTLTYYNTHVHYTRCGSADHANLCSNDLNADLAYQCSIGSLTGSGRGTYTGDCGLTWVWRTYGSCQYGS